MTYATQHDDGLWERSDHEDDQWWYQQDLEQQEYEQEQQADWEMGK